MTEPVKRYVTTCDCMSEAVWGDYVRQDDYAHLEQECERLRALLADWSSHFTGPKVIGGPLSSLRERTEEALSAKP